MIGDSAAFSPRTAMILRDANRKIRDLAGGSHHALYSYWRVTMGKICPVDAFYVGFRQVDGMMIFPYNFDGREYVYPDFHTYGPGGVAEWIFTTRKPYMYAQDDGRMLHRGASFGDTERMSSDAVSVPLFDGKGVVTGIAGMQSYRAGVYEQEHVRAFEFTANSVATVLRREREDADATAALDEPGNIPSTTAEIIDEVCRKLRSLKLKIDDISDHVPDDDPDLRRRTTDLQRHCERIQTETMEILLRSTVDAKDLLDLLTPREREIARLIAEGMDNETIAVALSISVFTVKTHTTHILGKFGVRQRAGVTALLRPLP